MNRGLADSNSLDIHALLARCLGNSSLMDRVLMKFARQLDEDLARLESALQQENAIEVAELAHRIKGTAGSVEARRLYESSARMETLALQGQWHEVTRCMERLQDNRSELAAQIESRSRNQVLSASR